MAFPVVEGVRTKSLKDKPFDLNLPTSIASGELLLAVIVTNGTIGPLNWPAGWTVLIGTDVGNRPNLYAAWRTADGTEGSSIEIDNDREADTMAACFRISGWSGNAPEISSDTNGENSAPNPPSLTASWGSADNLWFAVCGVDDRAPSIPANYGNETTENKGSYYLSIARRELATATEDPGAVSISDDEDWRCVTIVVEPAGGAAADELTADDVESASEVTAPTVGQAHVLTATSIEAASQTSSPSVGQAHVLTTASIESASEVTAPAIGTTETHVLTADDVESASEVTAPVIGQAHALLADDVESASEVTAPSVGVSTLVHASGVQATFFLSSMVVWSGVVTIDASVTGAWTNLAPTQTAVYTNATPSTGNTWTETTL